MSKKISLPQIGYSVTFSTLQNDRSSYLSTSEDCFLDADCCQGYDWIIRNRRIGDRFQPFGRDHSIRLSRYLMDKKMVRRERDVLPLFFNRDVLVWVPGCSISDLVKITPETRLVLHIHLEKINDNDKV